MDVRNSESNLHRERDTRVVTMNELKAIVGVHGAEAIYREIVSRKPSINVFMLPIHERLAYATAAWIKAFSSRPCTTDLADIMKMRRPVCAAACSRAINKGLLCGFRSRTLGMAFSPEDAGRGRWAKRYYEPNWDVIPRYLKEARPFVA